MIVYVILFLMAFTGVMNYDLQKGSSVNLSKSKVLFIYLSIFAIFLMSFRYRLGVDGLEYEDSFYSAVPPISDIFSNGYLVAEEPLYLLLCSILKEFSDNIVLYQIVTSVLVNTTVFVYFYKKSRNPYICALIYFSYNWFYWNCELQRQCISIAVFLIIEKCIKQNKLLYYYLGATIAVFFHYSAIILFIVPFIGDLALKRKLLFKIVLIALLVAPLFKYLSQMNLYFIGAYFGDKFHVYASRSEEATFTLYGVISIAIPLFLLYISANPSRTPMKYDKYIISFLFFLLISPYFSMAKRFGTYFEVFYILEIAELLSRKCKSYYNNSLKPIVFVLLFSIMTFNYYTWFGIKTFDGKHRQYVAIYPYSSVFFPEKYPERENSGWNYLH